MGGGRSRTDGGWGGGQQVFPSVRGAQPYAGQTVAGKDVGVRVPSLPRGTSQSTEILASFPIQKCSEIALTEKCINDKKAVRASLQSILYDLAK